MVEEKTARELKKLLAQLVDHSYGHHKAIHGLTKRIENLEQRVQKLERETSKR
jgi:polyhydroxyalkanoate synthesis regulator phasin